MTTRRPRVQHEGVVVGAGDVARPVGGDQVHRVRMSAVPSMPHAVGKLKCPGGWVEGDGEGRARVDLPHQRYRPGRVDEGRGASLTRPAIVGVMRMARPGRRAGVRDHRRRRVQHEAVVEGAGDVAHPVSGEQAHDVHAVGRAVHAQRGREVEARRWMGRR